MVSHISRRQVLTGAAAAAAVTASSPVVAQARPTSAKTAIVIGSGFGGAVAAQRLGQAGITTTVLERGRRWELNEQGTTFPTLLVPDRRMAYLQDRSAINQLTRFFPIPRYTGLIERVEGRGLNAVFGAGVGGGSLAFGGFTPQPRRREWDKIFPADIDYNTMDSVYFPRARAGIGTSPLPADLLARPEYVGAREWLRTIESFGADPVLTDFACDWDLAREEIAGTKRKSLTVGEYVYGTNSGAKISVDRTYLARAEATGNVTVKPLHTVTEITELPGGRFSIGVDRIDELGNIVGKEVAECDMLFMAAGAFHSSALLVTARARKTLTRLNEHTGQGYGTNGDFLTVHTLLPRNVGAPQGGPGVAMMYDDDNPLGTASIAWEAAPLPWFSGGFTTTNLIQVDTAERGYVAYDPAEGRAVLNYPYPRDNTDVDVKGRAFAHRFQARTQSGFAGSSQLPPIAGLPIYSPLADMGSGTTWHSLGGMVMGKAADTAGRVKGYNNLFVVDGSLIPGSTGLVNPALTITAIAERCMDQILGTRPA